MYLNTDQLARRPGYSPLYSEPPEGADCGKLGHSLAFFSNSHALLERGLYVYYARTHGSLTCFHMSHQCVPYG